MKKYSKVLLEIIQNSKTSIILETPKIQEIVQSLEKNHNESFLVSEVFEYSKSKKGFDKKDIVPNQFYISIKYSNTPFKHLII